MIGLQCSGRSQLKLTRKKKKKIHSPIHKILQSEQGLRYISEMEHSIVCESSNYFKTRQIVNQHLIIKTYDISNIHKLTFYLVELI